MIKTIKKYLSGYLKLVLMRHSEPAKQVKNLNAMKNKILPLRYALRGKMTDKCSGSLKDLRLLMILCLFAHTAYAQHDIAKSENYLPNGKYRLFGSGRGEVRNIDNQIRLHGQLTQQAGNLSIETRLYQGDLSYQQHFHHHGHSVHAPFENKAQRNFSAKTGSVVQGGATLTDLSVTGYEIHPADAYDGEQGGGYPVPTGARDEYLYEVNGKEVSVKVVALDKLPPKANDNQLLRQVGIVPERYNPPQPTDNRTPIERVSFANTNNGNAYGDFVDLTHSGQAWDSATTSWTSTAPERGAAYYSNPSVHFGRIVPQARMVLDNSKPSTSENPVSDRVSFANTTPAPSYNPYDDPTTWPLFNSSLNNGSSGSSGNRGENESNDYDDPTVLGYYYEDEDNEPLKLGYYDDDQIWESENTWGLTGFYPNNQCYGDCVIRLNDPTQQYGGRLTPTRGAYAPSEQVVVAEFFVNINNFEAALITGALTLPPVIEQGIRNALESGDSKKAKNIYNQYAQSQAAGGAMPPDDGDNDGIKKKNDYTNKPKQKVNSTEKGDVVRTPDSHPQDFDILKQRNGTFYKNKYTGEIWQESRTTHTGKQGEWKVGIGKKEPTPTRKITVDKQTGKVLKHD